jgi:uncharacterized membrane protein YdjX (TVP38/TMEM64 family)
MHVSAYKKIAKELALFAGVIVFVGVALYFYQQWIAEKAPLIAEFLGQFGTGMSFVFVLFTAVATAAFMPISLFLIIGGALFGVGWGTVFSVVGVALGSWFVFELSGIVGRRYFTRHLGEDRRLGRAIRFLGHQGLWGQTLIRLNYLFPPWLQNIAAGLAPNRRRGVFLGAIILGDVPYAFAYAYFGFAIATIKLWHIIISSAMLVALFWFSRFTGGIASGQVDE